MATHEQIIDRLLVEIEMLAKEARQLEKDDKSKTPIYFETIKDHADVLCHCISPIICDMVERIEDEG